MLENDDEIILNSILDAYGVPGFATGESKTLVERLMKLCADNMSLKMQYYALHYKFADLARQIAEVAEALGIEDSTDAEEIVAAIRELQHKAERETQ